MCTNTAVLVVRDAGRFLVVPAAMAVTAIPFCFVDQQWMALAAFGLTVIVSAPFYYLCHRIPLGKEDHDLGSAMSTVALAWLLVAFVCSIPLYLTARFAPAGSEVSAVFGGLCNAFFEGMSGITSCGLSLSRHPDALPVCIQWWRSLSEWIGGVGVVVLMLLLIDPDRPLYNWYRAEGRSWRLDSSLRKTARRIWVIFSALTLVCILAFRWSGASWWEAINNGMTAISTGGFTIRSDSFQSALPGTRAVAVVFIMLGAVSFRTYSRMVYQHIPPWRHATQARCLVALLLVGSIMLFAVLPPEWRNWSVVFQWTSALGTCGFSSVDLSLWPPRALLMLVLGMSIGGAAGSTSGGIKISRLLWLAKKAMRLLLCRQDSEGYRYNESKVDPSEAERRIRHAAILVSLWLLTLAAGWGVMKWAMPQETSMHLLFETSSALGCVGLSCGVVDAGMPVGAGLCLSVLMWAGRLEIISAVLLVFMPLGRHADQRVAQSLGEEQVGVHQGKCDE